MCALKGSITSELAGHFIQAIFTCESYKNGHFQKNHTRLNHRVFKQAIVTNDSY